MAAVIVELAARKFTLPAECPCCGAPPDSELSVTAQATRQSLAFPYCRRCTGHLQQWETSGVASAGLMVLAILAVIGLAVAGMFLLAIGVFVVGASLAWVLRSSRRAAAKAACGESCATPGQAVTYLGWANATHRFSFASPTFAARFAEANQSLLANETPQLRKLLDGYRKARLAVPTPAVAAGVAPPPLTARDWTARLESTSGTVMRRIALLRALEMIEEPQPRRELIQTVARIELAPLLDKLQRQSSPAAKRSLLNAAIAKIREDNIPDELQAAELEKLEARLAEL
ncbi:MAG TPA: hypothetical protein VFV99_25380 [Kofleriaceae bacterium]|nr:hypothetical protein [Kofleriaceae bacterium]